ncbi:hypothetical protein HZS_6443 [Henneguya salminicola]|nr:hypothetical protein HZS_6443 [Henneguya salminicola]
MEDWKNAIENIQLFMNTNRITSDFFEEICKFDDTYSVLHCNSMVALKKYSLKLTKNSIIIVKNYDKNKLIKIEKTQYVISKCCNTSTGIKFDIFSTVIDKSINDKDLTQYMVHCIELPNEFSLDIEEIRYCYGRMLQFFIINRNQPELPSINFLCDAHDKKGTRFLALKQLLKEKDKLFCMTLTGYSDNLKKHKEAMDVKQHTSYKYNLCRENMNIPKISVTFVFNRYEDTLRLKDSAICITRVKSDFIKENFVSWMNFNTNFNAFRVLVQMFQNNKLTHLPETETNFNNTKFNRKLDFLETLWDDYTQNKIDINSLLDNIDKIVDTRDIYFIHSANRTQLGSVVRFNSNTNDKTKTDFENPYSFLKLVDLIPKTKASLLLEIGIHKIIQDIINFFDLENINIENDLYLFVGNIRNHQKIDQLLDRLKYVLFLTQTLHLIKTYTTMCNETLAIWFSQLVTIKNDSISNLKIPTLFYIICPNQSMNLKFYESLSERKITILSESVDSVDSSKISFNQNSTEKINVNKKKLYRIY